MIGSPFAMPFGVEAGEVVVFDGETDLDWFAADFAVFHVGWRPTEKSRGIDISCPKNMDR
jgi:hypothetical protein